MAVDVTPWVLLLLLAVALVYFPAWNWEAKFLLRVIGLSLFGYAALGILVRQ